MKLARILFLAASVASAGGSAFADDAGMLLASLDTGPAVSAVTGAPIMSMPKARDDKFEVAACYNYPCTQTCAYWNNNGTCRQYQTLWCRRCE